MTDLSPREIDSELDRYFVGPDDAKRAVVMADAAMAANGMVGNIGARRLQTVMERVLEETSFKASDLPGQTVAFDGDAVRARLADLAGNEDLSRYIL